MAEIIAWDGSKTTLTPRQTAIRSLMLTGFQRFKLHLDILNWWRADYGLFPLPANKDSINLFYGGKQMCQLISEDPEYFKQLTEQ